MSGIAQMVDLGAKLLPSLGVAGNTVTAGSGADGTQQIGIAQDRYLLPSPGGAGSPGNPTPLSEVFGFGTALGPGGGGATEGVKDNGFLYSVVFETVLADSETLTLAGDVQQADDAGFTVNVSVLEPRARQPLITALTDLVITAPSSGGPHTIRGQFLGRYDTTTARRFVRMRVTPTLSAVATDTVNLTGVLTFFGSQINPFRSDGEFVN